MLLSRSTDQPGSRGDRDGVNAVQPIRQVSNPLDSTKNLRTIGTTVQPIRQAKRGQVSNPLDTSSNPLDEKRPHYKEFKESLKKERSVQRAPIFKNFRNAPRPSHEL